MRMQHRSKQKFKYAYYKGQKPVYDEDGNFTGEYAPSYTEPMIGWGNINSGYISANHMSGTATPEMYGIDLDYIKTIMTSTDYGLDEYSVIWIDNLDSPTHDYIIRRIGRGINNVRIACSHVDVTR